jgi:hypothetical protein
MRYKGQITSRQVDRDYPHQVEIAIPISDARFDEHSGLKTDIARGPKSDPKRSFAPRRHDGRSAVSRRGHFARWLCLWVRQETAQHRALV